MKFKVCFSKYEVKIEAPDEYLAYEWAEKQIAWWKTGGMSVTLLEITPEAPKYGASLPTGVNIRETTAAEFAEIKKTLKSSN